MRIIFIDFEENRKNLLPFTYTRPIAEIRCGILKISEKWSKYLNLPYSFKTAEYLQSKYSTDLDSENLIINSAILPDKKLVKEINNLKNKEALYKDKTFIAAKADKEFIEKNSGFIFVDLQEVEYSDEVSKIERLWHIFSLNGQEIAKDFKLITEDRKSQKVSKTNTVYNTENIFLEQGAVVENSVLDAREGFIYLGKDSEIMEFSVIKGSLALCEHSVLKIRTTVYGATTIGPHSKFGGEINNTVVFGYSNKAHDGFLGNSVIGEWCNIGAGSNNSNLKNNYQIVKLWNYALGRFEKTGLQFCGLIMGDHSKCGINTMFNTGTVVGVSANIFGSGFPRNFIPSFSWGGAHGFVEYKFDKAIETASKVMQRRQVELNEIEKEIFLKVYDISKKNRK